MSTITQPPARNVRHRGGWPSQPKRPRPNRRLAELLADEGLSPNYLAVRAGVSGNSVRVALAGRRVSPRIQKAIADALHVRVLEIWPLEGWR